MTGKELRNKIAKHVCCACEMGLGDGECAEGSDYRKCGVCGDVADALIAAGIVDLKEHRIFAGKDGSIKQLYNGEEVKKMAKERKELKDELRSKVDYIHEQDKVIKEYKHRAARAERALQKFAENITCEDCPFFSDCASSEKMGYPIHSYHCFSEYLKQAEKELAEEGKDD